MYFTFTAYLDLYQSHFKFLIDTYGYQLNSTNRGVSSEILSTETQRTKQKCEHSFNIKFKCKVDISKNG